LRELQVASEENMTGDGSSGTTAELLRECRLSLARLRATDGDSGAAPTKQGARKIFGNRGRSSGF